VRLESTRGFASFAGLRDSSSPRHELDRGVAPPLRPETAHVLERGPTPVLVCVRALDLAANPLPSNADCANPNLSVADLNHAEGIAQECSIPAVRFLHPRPGEHAPVDDHGPDPNEAMISPRSSPDSQDRAFVHGFHNTGRKAAFHGGGVLASPVIMFHVAGVVSVEPFLAKISARSFAGCVSLAFFETSCVAPGCS